jgi:CheY-like chemotaxis protein/two-component sensor histidine kinase
MLAYAGKGRLFVKPISLSKLVQEMASLLNTVISKKALLRFEFDENLPVINADPTQIRQVIMNLITNASDAIESRSGLISIRTGVVQVDQRYLRTTHLNDELKEGPYVFLEVSDSGCGMTEETQAKIFDPFFTTKFTGRGLGLAAVLGIVRGHQGGVKIYSEVGHGTTFRVLFPSCAAKETPDEDIISADHTWRSGGTVLVIDDEESVRDVCRTMLESRGLRVVDASDGRQGLVRFAEILDEVDLVLLDMTMPKLGGEEVYREMRLQKPDVKVILMSGYSEMDVMTHFAGKHLAGFLQKPFRIDQMVRLVRGELDSKAPERA